MTKRFATGLIVIGIFFVLGSAAFAAEESNYYLELGGLGFAFHQTSSTPGSFLLRVVSEGSPGSAQPCVAEEFSAVRLGYETYPMEVITLRSNYLEADVYSPVITTSGELSKEKKIGKLQVTLALFNGIPGGKGSFLLDDKVYTVFFLESRAQEAFERWTPELE